MKTFENIRAWAQERGIYDKGNSHTQYVKLQEEAGELAKALLKDDEPEIVDAIGDIVVVLTNLAHLRGYKIEDCIESAYSVIKDRKGNMKNGTFVKNEGKPKFVAKLTRGLKMNYYNMPVPKLQMNEYLQSNDIEINGVVYGFDSNLASICVSSKYESVAFIDEDELNTLVQ